ncbi:MAG: amidophosphoribosyltransferase, partial [Nitrospirota bacterium]
MAFVQENCGLFGIYGDRECVSEIYSGIDFLQHRGQEYCGIATYAAGIHLVTHYGKVGNTFNDYDLNFLKGSFGIGHVSLRERQPLAYQSRLGEIALGFSGNILNADELIEEIKNQGKSFQQGYHIEVIAKIIMAEADVVSGIRRVAEGVRGAYSLLILTETGIYAVRDVYGFRPLILGCGGGRHAVSSESRALQNLDMEVVRDVLPGEILFINAQGFRTMAQLPSSRRAHCAFEWAYTASVDSVIDGVFVQEARNRLGQSLAERDLREGGLEVDIVAPVPMSGIGHALGYHQRSGVTYQEVFLYNRYADRSYTLSTQFARERMAKRKLSVLKYAVRDKRIVLVDDSIV